MFWLVAALFAVDLFFIVYFGVGKTLYEFDRDPFLYNHKELMITTDGGVPEWFNYLKTLLVVALLVRLARTTWQPIYASLALVFLVVVLDDAMEIHETVGKSLARALDIPRVLGLRGRDVGEVMTWMLLGALVVPLLLLALPRSTRVHRGNGLALLLSFGALVVCGVVVDQLGPLSDVFHGAGVLLDVVEDGGEMLAITTACALALGAERERRTLTPSAAS